MFAPLNNDTVEIIYGFDCHIPPFGYGVNVSTGKLEKTDVIKRSSKPEDQYWERTLLPKDWDKKRREEILMQQDDDEYVDLKLEKFRTQEWKRRLCGVWVFMNGVPVYITGLHYFYMNWWKIDVGYPEYRDPDRKFFYVWRYCETDPRCCGLIEATKRRQGKTYRGGCIVYEYCSRNAESTGGAQSKTKDDAQKQVFQKAIIHPFKKLPDFFIPVFDTSKGLTPTSELRFIKTTKKGRNAMADVDKPELNSIIDYRSSEEFAYDGYKTSRYFRDESGKTMEADVYKSHQVVRFCLEENSAWIGKCLYSTTVEDMESGGANFKLLWLDSDPAERDRNGHTKSGMYRYFMPATETLYYNKYGMPDTARAMDFFLNQRAGLAGNLLSSIKRKSPFNEHEMFYMDGERCLYNSELLNDRLDFLSWRDNLTERGNFVWKDGVRFSEVEWVKDKHGRYEICWLFENKGQANQVGKNGNQYYPKNNHNFNIGVDPFKFDKVKDARRSDCSSLAYKKFDASQPTHAYNDAFVIRYTYRAATTSLQYEDILKMAWYLGCQILFERNVDSWKEWFIQNGCGAFLMRLPGETDYGIYSDGHGKVLQSLCDHTESYIENNITKVFFKTLVQGWLEFKVDNTTAYDEPMAAGYALIGARSKKYKQENLTSANEVTNFFRQYSSVAS